VLDLLVDDEELYRRVRRGDLAAFDALYGRYERRLFAFIHRLLRSKEDAEEVFHDAFLAVLQSREVALGEASFSTWVHRVARNMSLNRLRSRRRGEAALVEIPVAVPSEKPADEQIATRQLHLALGQAVERLPSPLSELYRLRSAGLSYEEMAEALEIPVGTVKSRMHQLVAQLKEDVDPWIARASKPG
jgi:RNA polymerase sigma-70 factor, ECF subfamily